MKILLPLAVCGMLAIGSPAELRKAEDLYQQTRYKDALQAVQPLLGKDGEALVLAGRAAIGMGEFKKASEFLERAVTMDAASSNAHHWLGRAYGRRAETSFPVTAPHWASKARQSFEKAVQLDPKNGEALNDLFEYYLQAPGFLGGGLDKAQALLPKIQAVDIAEYEFAMAKLQEARKDFNSAEQHLKRAAELAPKSVGRVLDVARFFARQGRFNESFAWLGRAEKLSPRDPQVLYKKAETYIEAKKNLPEARALLEAYLRQPLNPEMPTKEDAEKLLKKANGGD